MDRLELARTIEARLEADPDLAKTLVQKPRLTIEPHRHASQRGLQALEALRKLGAGLDANIALHRTIGEGGMGIVHLGTQATLGRHVAVKTLRDDTKDLDATLRILREAWVTGALEHPNVVPVYDVGVDAGGSPIIIMKRIEGRSWSELMRAPDDIKARFSSTDPLEWNLRILENVCNAVQFAHSKNILHRDLKPENVMIGGFGEVYLLDWGIAVSLVEDPSGRLPPLSQATDVAGTPCYMAPEMLAGDPDLLGVRTDVYLLGAIFYEIFAGAPPHEGDNVQAMIASVVLSEPKFPAHFPQEARAICSRAMSRDPQDRYEDVQAMRDAIAAYLRHRGSRKLAWDAKQSLNRMLDVLKSEPPGEERTLAVFNLLGECRFGYRSALSAWPDNDNARAGLDRALLAVVDHELTEGDAHAAAALLREVSAPPADVQARVESAVRGRAEQDERLKRMEQDLDPNVGGRTRTFVGTLFGIAWTFVPLVGWLMQLQGRPASHLPTIGFSAGFLLGGIVLYRWARESLSKTMLNRRVSATLAVHLVAQMVLGAGELAMGITPQQGLINLMFAWGLTQALLAVWVERWFAAPAIVCALSFVTASFVPSLSYPLMSLDNLILTIVLVRVWFPKQDVARIMERRAELRQRARRWLVEGGSP